MRTLAILASLVLAALLAGGLVLYAGWYDISATDPHLRPTFALLDFGMRRSVRQRGADIAAPALEGPGIAQRGAQLYRRHCEQCHGGPGVAPEPFALGMTPTPANLVHTAREWQPADLYWVIREGIKMTGMPAWRHRMSDDEMWATVAFLKAMTRMEPRQYQEAVGRPSPLPPGAGAGGEGLRSLPLPLGGGAAGEGPDPKRGRRAIHQYACLTCHEIPGLTGANAPVGPPLGGIARREMIAGTLRNTPQNMVRWLRSPQAVNPGSAMPDLGLGARDAADIAAFLATLD